jgi:hypothetical protein
MQRTPEHEAAIRQIVAALKCGRDRPCYTCDFTTVGRVKSLGGGVFECLEDRGRACPHGVSFGHSIICHCPLRRYLALHGLA